MDWQERNQQVLARGLAIIRALPYTQMVALTGSIAEKKATANSDIDLFIQIKEGRLWSTRFFITLILQVAGLRRTDNEIAGKLCLNWFATYHAPAAQPGRVFEIVWQESTKSKVKLILEKLGSGYMGNLVEKILKKYQISRIERDWRTHQPGGAVRYSDRELGFHPPKTRS